MRLLFLNHNLREHGTWFRACHLAAELVRLGHQVSIWTVSPHHWYRPIADRFDGVEVVETPSWNPVICPDDGWGPIDIAYRSARIVREPFDLLYVFAHPPNVYLPMRLTQIFRRKPVVVDWCDVYRDGIFPLREEMRSRDGAHGLRLAAQRWAERIETRMERGIVRRARAVTVISKELERAALEVGVTKENLLRFPSGANIEAIRPLDKVQCRRKLGIEGEGPFLGYVANYNPDEVFFLASLARVFRRHPSARLISASPPFSRATVEQAGVGSNLVELGRLPFSRMATVLGAADVLALPLEDNASNRGRWPNKFGDYLAAGRPIAANAVGDIADYFAETGAGVDAPQTGQTESAASIGLAVLPRVADFGDAMSDLLTRTDEWDAMGAASRRLAETRLNWVALAGEADKFLRRFA